MKNWLFAPVFGLLAISGVSKGDVVPVLTNYVTAGAGFSGASMTGQNFIFTTPSSYVSSFLDEVKFRIHNNSSEATITSMTFSFTLARAGGANVFTNQAVTSFNTIGNNSAGDATFALGALPNMPSGADTYTLSWTFADGNISSSGGTVTTADVRWATTTTEMTTDAGWGFTSSSVTNAQFRLTANVPEPTTIVLTGSALAAGLGASMLRRFRKKPEPQQPAA